MKVLIEKYWPWIASLVITYLTFKFAHFDINEADNPFDKLLEYAIRINTVLIGFFLTIFTILGSIETRRMQFIKESGAYPRLIGFLKISILFQFISITGILISPFIRFFGVPDEVVYWAVIIQFFIVLLSWSLSLRFVKIFIKLISDP